MNSKRLKAANLFRNIARFGLLSFTICLIGFSMLSGAEVYENGANGILLNIPNAIPWFFLLTLTLLAWQWELIGGVLICISAVAIFFALAFINSNYLWLIAAICSTTFLLGGFFILSSTLRRSTY